MASACWSQIYEPSSHCILRIGHHGDGDGAAVAWGGVSSDGLQSESAESGGVAAEGAHPVDTPRHAAAEGGGGADVLISMVADDAASRAIWVGGNGRWRGAAGGWRERGRPGTGRWWRLSAGTLTVPWVRELGAAAEGRGLAFLDAPVTGTKPHAAKGELTFLVGGAAAALDAVRPVLAVMSKEIIHLGPVGSGAVLKLINNFLCGVQAAALAEAYAFIAREKLDADKALPLLLNGGREPGVQTAGDAAWE